MSELIDCINNLSAKDIIKSIAKTANGTPFYLQTSGGVAFCTAFQAVYDSWTNKPSAADASAMNDLFVCPTVEDGVWAKLSVLQVYAAHNVAANERFTNWVNPGTYTASEIGVNTWVVNEGFTPNGSSSCLDSGFNPNPDAKYTLNDASMGLYVRQTDNVNDADAGAENAALDRIFLYSYLNGAIRAFVNSTLPIASPV